VKEPTGRRPEIGRLISGFVLVPGDSDTGRRQYCGGDPQDD